MNKEQLTALGLTKEQAEKVTGLHKEALDGNYVPKDRFNAVNAELKQLKDSLKERDEQLESLKTAAGAVGTLKKQIEELQAANQEQDRQHAAEIKRVKRGALDERLLSEAKAINPLAVKPFLTAIDDGVDEEGYIALRKQHIEALAKAESTRFLFRAADEGQRFTGLKPGETGVEPAKNKTANPFVKDTYDEAAQIRLFRENPDMARAMAKQAGIPMY